MALVSSGEEAARRLATKALAVVDSLWEDEEEGELEELLDLKARRAEAKKFLAQQGSAPGDALQAAVKALEGILRWGVPTGLMHPGDGELEGLSPLFSGMKAPLIKSRLREVTWLIKDAAALFKKAGDTKGRAVALEALARAHLSRQEEPDAPDSALKAIGEAVALFREAGDFKQEACAYLAAVDAHMAKASSSPFEQVMQQETDKAVQMTRDASALFKKQGNKRGVGLATLSTAIIYIGTGDEDMVGEAEKYADDASEIFQTLGEKTLEMRAILTLVSTRVELSGHDSGLLLSKEKIQEWRTEGQRQAHEAALLHTSAEIHLGKGEADEAIRACKEAQELYERLGRKRGVAAVWRVMHGAHLAKKEVSDAQRALRDVARIYQGLGDRRAEGSAHALMLDMLLGNLTEEVEESTRADKGKKDASSSLTPDAVAKRTEEALDCAALAFDCYEEAQDQAGVAMVREVIQGYLQRGVDVYCETTEPDHIVARLNDDGKTEKERSYEWKIHLPRFKKYATEAGNFSPDAGILTVKST